jgi:hypothetical protein
MDDRLGTGTGVGEVPLPVGASLPQQVRTSAVSAALNAKNEREI